MTKEEIIKVLNKLQEEAKERNINLNEEEWVAIFSATRHLNDAISKETVSADLEEASMTYLKGAMKKVTELGEGTPVTVAFKAGAKWQENQGVSFEAAVDYGEFDDGCGYYVDYDSDTESNALEQLGAKVMDHVIVQIRKKKLKNI